MAIIELTTKLTDAIDDRKLTAAIFLDLSKAFDTVDHSIIISKLEHYHYNLKIRTLWNKRNCTPVV